MDDVVNPLAGKSVTLIPISPSHYESLYQAELSGFLLASWRHQGTTPSFDSYVQSLWAGVLCQFLVVENTSRRMVGIVSCYNPNLADGYASIGIAKFSPEDRSGRLLEGSALFLDYVFTCWDLRKLYAESTEYNFKSGLKGAEGIIFDVEGCLKAHTFRDGQHWDLYQLAIYRANWERIRSIVLRFVRAGERFRQDHESAFLTTKEWVK